MKNRTSVGILCGGRSGEHEVSLLSAKSIISAIDRNKYDITVIGIGKDGSWWKMNEEDFLLNPDDPLMIALNSNGNEVLLSPKPGTENLRTSKGPIKLDVIFPVLHGTYGEDGTLQGMLGMLGIPYVGADHLGSSAAMDKDMAKRLFREAGLNVLDHLVFNKELDQPEIKAVIEKIEKTIPYPVFVKPANLGSSVGISKAHDRDELLDSLKDAWLYDTKILVEKGISAREIECAVFGNSHVTASELGEIIPRHEFYSYEAKYIDPDGAELIVGVELPEKMKTEVQRMAKVAFKALCCEGMSRADFFVDKNTGEIFINELNTIPGFTKISMYPKLMEKSGVPYAELISQLIELAIHRNKLKQELKTDFRSQ